MSATPLAVIHSVPTPAAISACIEARWNVGSVRACHLLRSYTNDVYRVVADDGTFALKVYRRGWRDAADARWEAALCDHLLARGVRVPQAIAGRDGDPAQEVTAPEGERAALLTTWLPGAKPAPPFSLDLYRDFGRAAARFHLATTDFHPGTQPRVLDAGTLFRHPFASLHDALAGRDPAYRRLREVGEQASDRLDELWDQLPHGCCHGDLTLDHLHLVPGGEIALHDFDLAGHGCFAFDFAIYHEWVGRDESAGPKWQALQAGYAEVRPFTAAERAALPWLTVAYQIWDFAQTLVNWRAWTGEWNATAERIEVSLEAIFATADRAAGEAGPTAPPGGGDPG